MFHFKMHINKTRLVYVSLFLFLFFVFCVFYLNKLNYNLKPGSSDFVFPKVSIEALPTDEPNCIKLPVTNQGPSFKSAHYGIPICFNLVKAMTQGKWIEDNYRNVDKEKDVLSKLLVKFRVKHEGFSAWPFRSDGRCGFNNQLQYKPPIPFDASSWCDPSSTKPCCSGSLDGYCTDEDSCVSRNSVNLKEFVHAEVSKWVIEDKSCQIQLYDQESACALLHDKNVKSIGFVGNSLMRNMYIGAIKLLTDNYYNGSILQCIPPSLRKKCVGHWLNMDKFCIGQAVGSSSEVLPHYGICNGHLESLVYHSGLWKADFGSALKQEVLRLLDVPGTYLLAGIGVHDHFDYEKIMSQYLKPSFDALLNHKWPKFVWVHPLKSGIFKPPGYVAMHGNDDVLDKFVEQTERFCASYDIPTLDFRPLTTGVWSVDGTHYGTGVNKMKVQMFLNMLASNQVFK